MNFEDIAEHILAFAAVALMTLTFWLYENVFLGS